MVPKSNFEYSWPFIFIKIRKIYCMNSEKNVELGLNLTQFDFNLRSVWIFCKYIYKSFLSNYGPPILCKKSEGSFLDLFCNNLEHIRIFHEILVIIKWSCTFTPKKTRKTEWADIWEKDTTPLQFNLLSKDELFDRLVS